MTRSRRAVRKLLRTILKQAEPITTNGRYALRGANSATLSVAVRKASDYLAALKTAPPIGPLPLSLRQTVAALRKQAANTRLHCTARMQACEHLLRIEGVTVPIQGDEIEKLIVRELGQPVPEKPESLTTTEVRAAARRQALTDIIGCFNSDRATFRALADVVLRLPETPAPAVEIPAIDTRAALEKALASLRRNNAVHE
jgi:hypothetical protein